MGGHRNLEYAFWANEQTFGSAVLLFLGGVTGAVPYIGFNGTLTFYELNYIGIYSAVIGLILMFIEYPRGKRSNGRVMERRFQNGPAKFVTALGPLTRNYFSRFVLYFILSIPSFILITSLLGGVGVTIGSLIYLTSAIKGEQWRSPVTNRPTETPAATNAKYLAAAPSNPPPRRPVNSASAEADDRL